jgi:hypothetical protein
VDVDAVGILCSVSGGERRDEVRGDLGEKCVQGGEGVDVIANVMSIPAMRAQLSM